MSSNKSISILIADDHTMVRSGLAATIGQDPRFRIVGAAANGRAALELFQSLLPDLVLMDINMPHLSGVQATEQIRNIDPAARIVILTSYDDEEDICQGLRAGARGYLLKDSSADEIIECLLAVHGGRKFIPQVIATKLAEHMDFTPLSNREKDILELISAGKSNKRIARSAGISEGTVKFHVNNILSKLRVSSRTEAVTVALKRGMVKMNSSYA
jgi:DNA-binding NarL/FixJ family response regulator